MTYKGGEFNVEQLLAEVLETAERERVGEFGQYKDLIDDIVEEKRIYGFFSDDEDLSQIKENLQARWPEIEELLLKKVGKPFF